MEISKFFQCCAMGSTFCGCKRVSATTQPIAATRKPSVTDGPERSAIAAFLSAPSFLYRSEMGEPQPDGTYRLTPWQVASALSYTLWGTTPDAALLASAESGGLETQDDVRAAAQELRQLVDERPVGGALVSKGTP